MNENKKDLDINENEEVRSDNSRSEWSRPSISSKKINELTLGFTPNFKDLPVVGMGAGS